MSAVVVAHNFRRLPVVAIALVVRCPVVVAHAGRYFFYREILSEWLEVALQLSSLNVCACSACAVICCCCSTFVTCLVVICLVSHRMPNVPCFVAQALSTQIDSFTLLILAVIISLHCFIIPLFLLQVCAVLLFLTLFVCRLSSCLCLLFDYLIVSCLQPYHTLRFYGTILFDVFLNLFYFIFQVLEFQGSPQGTFFITFQFVGGCAFARNRFLVWCVASFCSRNTFCRCHTVANLI